jgi:hypothetical protein
VNDRKIPVQTQTSLHESPRGVGVGDDADHSIISALRSRAISAGNAFAYASAHLTR